MKYKNNTKEWILRYLPAELVAIVGALVAGLLADHIFHNAVFTALAGTWGDNLCYYTELVYVSVKNRKTKDAHITPKGLLKVVRDLFLEFGPGEYLDATIIRPAAMYFFPKILGNIGLGLIVGKLVSDITFYIPTIFSYELRKKYIKD